MNGVNGMHKKDMFIGDVEANDYELYRDADGDVRVVSPKEFNKHFPGTKIIQVEGAELSEVPLYEPLKDETTRQIQSFYENRRD